MQCSRSSGLTANGPPMLRVLPRGTPGGARCLILGEGGSRCAPHHPPQPRRVRVPSVPAAGGRCGCPLSQRRGAMGDPLPCCAEDLLGGSHPPPLSSSCPFPPQPVSPLHKTVLRSFSPLSPDWGGGWAQQLLLSTAFGRTGSLHPDCLLGGWQPFAPVCRGYRTGNTLSPSKNTGSLTALGAQGCHHTLNCALGAADHLEGGMSLPLLMPAAPAEGLCFAGAAQPQG